MSTRPRKRVPTDELKRDLETKRQSVGQTLEHTSGVPLAAFSACDPTVEAKLIDDSIVQIFLHHMNKETAFVPSEKPQESSRDKPVIAADIQALMAAVDEIEQEPAPDLLENLAQERLWILADIAKHGGGLARQRATAELRETMNRVLEWDEASTFVLEQLVQLLGEASQRGDMPVLFSTLRLVAKRALREQQENKT